MNLRISQRKLIFWHEYVDMLGKIDPNYFIRKIDESMASFQNEEDPN